MSVPPLNRIETVEYYKRSALNTEKKAMERGIINVTLRVKQLEEEE
ncbi:unnamed protein product, partial [Nippostrongylus brasiliensis]|uniref:Transposase n=1 Tax=Nippostrongylus brasiliensis TaxID=27835 RepID=A0A0N4XSG9_NIPBR